MGCYGNLLQRGLVPKEDKSNPTKAIPRPLSQYREGIIMKTLNYFIWTLALLFSATQAQAQVEIGIIGSVNFASLTGEDSDGENIEADRRTLYGLGAVLDVPLNEHWSLRTEPMYLQKGAVNVDDDDIAFKGEFIEVPLFLKYRFGGGPVRPYVMAGPSVGFRLNTEVTFDNLDASGTFDADAVTESMDFGVDFGAGLNVRLSGVSLFLEGRYGLGVADVFKGGELAGQVTDDADVFTRGLQAMAGITIPIGGR